MKTTPLPEILKQITPLPLKVDRAGVNLIDPREKTEYVLAYCKGSTLAEVQSNAAYLAHAANVLPGLVKRMEKAENLLRRASEDLRAARMTGTPCYLEIEADEIRHAITLATSVPVNS